MKKISKEKLENILEQHKLWLESEGKEGKKADLKDADLENADLRNVNLSYANLSFAHLKDADLRNADLRNAILEGADLRNSGLEDSDLSYANLIRANLSNAFLRCAKLQESILKGANLSNADIMFSILNDADLRDANLEGAELDYSNLSYANLIRANLKGVSLIETNLSSASLKDAKNIPFIRQCEICPSDGAFIGWARIGEYIVKLKIPGNAKRDSNTNSDRECRCNKALVLAIQNQDGTDSGLKKIPLAYNRNVFFEIGKMVYNDVFDDYDRWETYPKGIHFYITRQEAVKSCTMFNFDELI